MKRSVVDETEPPRKGAEPDVFGNRQTGREAQLLLNDGNACRARSRRAEAPDGLAVDEDGTAVRLESTGQEVDQRGFA